MWGLVIRDLDADEESSGLGLTFGTCHVLCDVGVYEENIAAERRKS